jgi:CBS domain-containing protein
MSLAQLARKAVTLAPTATVLEAVRRMEQEKVGAVAVVRDGRLAGIFTERDVMLRVVLAQRDPKSTELSAVMTADPLSAGPTTSMAEALRVMVERHFRHLPVVGPDGQIVGIVSMRHMLRQRIDVLTEQLEGLANFAGADGIGG